MPLPLFGETTSLIAFLEMILGVDDTVSMARGTIPSHKVIASRFASAGFMMLAHCLALPQPAFAQNAPKSTELTQKQSELDQLANDAKLTAEKIIALDAQIATLKKDELAVTAALIQSAKTAKKLTADVSEIEERLSGQREEESGVLNSLRARRGVLAEVLAALQRMGLNPPPAILVKPEDALSSVRSAILLGAVVPELRSETEKLLADLDSLKRITNSINTERASLLATLKTQGEERHRLDALVVEKQKLRAQSETAKISETKRVQQLAERSGSLKDLISALRKDLDAEAQSAERARRDEEKRIALEREKARNGTQTALLVPGADLKALKGALTLPIAGKTVRKFGDDDGFGGTTTGMYVASSNGGVVVTPVDATVLYAGPFRSYHQLLILDAGSGYHLVMGGMDRSVVSVGQFILAGEPVGMMGAAKSGAAKTDAGKTDISLTNLPELYIELRQDGQPVDSAPWWADEPKGRTGNAT